MHQGSLFSAFSLALVISYLFYNSQSNKYEVISYCGFDLHLLDNDIEYLFRYLLVISIASLKNVYSGPLPIFHLGFLFVLLLNCISSLYILDINHLSDIWFIKYIFPFHRLPFILLFCQSFIFSFAKQKLFREQWTWQDFFFFFCPFAFPRAAPAPYGGSQARDPIKAVAAGLRHSYSNAGSKPRLQPTSQLMATPDP